MTQPNYCPSHVSSRALLSNEAVAVVVVEAAAVEDEVRLEAGVVLVVVALAEAEEAEALALVEVVALSREAVEASEAEDNYDLFFTCYCFVS